MVRWMQRREPRQAMWPGPNVRRPSVQTRQCRTTSSVAPVRFGIGDERLVRIDVSPSALTATPRLHR